MALLVWCLRSAVSQAATKYSLRSCFLFSASVVCLKAEMNVVTAADCMTRTDLHRRVSFMSGWHTKAATFCLPFPPRLFQPNVKSFHTAECLSAGWMRACPTAGLKWGTTCDQVQTDQTQRLINKRQEQRIVGAELLTGSRRRNSNYKWGTTMWRRQRGWLITAANETQLKYASWVHRDCRDGAPQEVLYKLPERETPTTEDSEFSHRRSISWVTRTHNTSPSQHLTSPRHNTSQVPVTTPHKSLSQHLTSPHHNTSQVPITTLLKSPSQHFSSPFPELPEKCHVCQSFTGHSVGLETNVQVRSQVFLSFLE